MSYCRWSSDAYQCDIYAFAHVQGTWEVWVAANRHVSTTPRPVVPSMPVPHANPTEWVTWSAGQVSTSQWLAQCDLKPIGLSCDGEQFSLGSPGEAADKMEELRALGYNVPQYAIDALREEQKEGDDE